MAKKASRKPNLKMIIACAIALATLLILYFGASITTKMQTQIQYNDFMKYVEDGKVTTADINSDSGKVTFNIKDSEDTYYTNYPYSEDFVEMLLLNDIDVKIHETNWLVVFFKYAFTPILMVLMLLFFAGMMGVSSPQPIEDNPSAKITFKDIAGMDEIKEDLSILTDMMKNDKYRMAGARVPRGILLEGPPGNGKTMLAKAFAGEANVKFFAVNACDFSSKFVGVGSDKIKALFKEARENAPSVIFIDELDAVGAKRAAARDAAGKEMNTILTALLNQMDGFHPMENVMVLAATNRASDLDSALIRPGRFDRQFVVDYPDKKTRRALFELYTKNKALDDDVDIDVLTRKTYGYSCAKIEAVINEALILSIKNNRKKISIKDFEDAILQMDIKGRLKKNFTQTDNEREITAYHEAGHAVIGHFLAAKKISNISIIPTTSGAGGFTLAEDADDDTMHPINDYFNQMVMLYSGRAAEVKLKGSIQNATAGASQDINEATKLATAYVELEKGIDYSEFGETGIKTIMELSEKVLSDAWAKSQQYVDEYWYHIKQVAEELKERETLSENEFLHIIDAQLKISV